jgi:thiamine kinase-like enzyme
MQLGYKQSISEYELKNIVWNGIEYDKKKLVRFVEKYEYLKTIEQTDEVKEEIQIMDKILQSHNSDNLQKLLQNDFEYSRWATIEKLARKATTEIILNGKYSKNTFETISNLPIVDYKLITKRSKELIKIINETIAEAEMDTSKIPGVK